MIESIAIKFNEGGVFMWVLLGILGVAVAIFIERFYFYLVVCKNVNTQSAGVAAKAIEGKDGKACQIGFAGKNDPLSALISVTLERFNMGLSLDDIQEGVDEEAVMQIPRFSERLNYLALFANVATLVGLLGTIAGLQESFASLGSVEATEKAAMLAKGIAKAMNTTAFGLIVAIPCMAGFTVLNNMQKKLVRTVDDSMLRLINFVRREKNS
jgi:biopolymer transport protein ExbB